MVNGYQPASLQEALKIKAENTATIYAGGTDLMVGKEKSDTFLFVNRIPEMRNITEDKEFLRIGAAVTFTEILESPLAPQVLKAAVKLIAAPAIQNMGTMGGNIGNASAKADSVLILYAADARLRLANIRGERVIPVEEFYLGNKKLDLAEDEIIVEILLPKTGLENYYYHKVGAREALAISRIAFAGIFAMDGERISNISIAFGAVADTILRFREIETMLVGKTLEEAKTRKADFLAAYEKAIVPIQGRVSSEYRKDVCMNLLNDFLTQNNI